MPRSVLGGQEPGFHPGREVFVHHPATEPDLIRQRLASEGAAGAVLDLRRALGAQDIDDPAELFDPVEFPEQIRIRERRQGAARVLAEQTLRHLERAAESVHAPTLTWATGIAFWLISGHIARIGIRGADEDGHARRSCGPPVSGRASELGALGLDWPSHPGSPEKAHAWQTE